MKTGAWGHKRNRISVEKRQAVRTAISTHTSRNGWWKENAARGHGLENGARFLNIHSVRIKSGNLHADVTPGVINGTSLMLCCCFDSLWNCWFTVIHCPLVDKRWFDGFKPTIERTLQVTLLSTCRRARACKTTWILWAHLEWHMWHTKTAST